MPYGTDADAINYHAMAGSVIEWAGFSTGPRDWAIFRASGYIDWVYGDRFTGTPTGTMDEWPRRGATDRYGQALSETEIPSQITAATFVAALYDLENPGVLWKKLDPAGQVQSQQTGPLKKQFFENSFDDPVILQSVEAIMRRLLTRASAGILAVVP